MAKKIDFEPSYEEVKAIVKLLDAYSEKYSRHSIIDVTLYEMLREFDYDPTGNDVWLLRSVKETYIILVQKRFTCDLDYGYEVFRDTVVEYLFKYKLATDEDPDEEID